MRLRQVSRPSTSKVSNSGGASLRPHTATRMGWNIWPALIFNSAAPARKAASRAACVNSTWERIAAGAVESGPGHGGVAFLRDQPGGIVRRQLVEEKEIGDLRDLAQQLNALLNQRSDAPHLADVTPRVRRAAVGPPAHPGAVA